MGSAGRVTRNVRLETAEPTSSLHASLRMARSFKRSRDAYFLRMESIHNVASKLDDAGYLNAKVAIRGARGKRF